MQNKLTIVWSRKAKKAFMSLDLLSQQRIEIKLEDLGDISAPPLDLKKLRHPKEHYRLRVGDYRVIFTRRGELDEICNVVAVHRRTTTTYSLHEDPSPYEYTIYKR